MTSGLYQHLKYLLLITFMMQGIASFGQATDSITVDKKTERQLSAVNDYIGFYQRFISDARGTKCLMYPSCSHYGSMVFKEKGFFTGFTLTAERLLRCGHESNQYIRLYSGGEFRLIDYPPYTNPPINLLNGNTDNQIFAYAKTTTAGHDSALLFVRYLINTEQYNSSLLEIERLFFHKKYTNCVELYVNKLICLRNLGQYETALFACENRFPKSIREDGQIQFQLSLIQYKLRNYDKSEKTLQDVKSETDSSLLERKYALKGILNARKGNWKDAELNLNRSSQISQNEYRHSKNRELLLEGIKLKKKKTAVGALLSLIPGFGYAYSGYYQTAITSLVTNAALAYATYTSIKSKNYGIAILSGSLNFGFYIGNIIGGSNSVKRTYESKKQHVIDSLENINNINH